MFITEQATLPKKYRNKMKIKNSWQYHPLFSMAYILCLLVLYALNTQQEVSITVYRECGGP